MLRELAKIIDTYHKGNQLNADCTGCGKEKPEECKLCFADGILKTIAEQVRGLGIEFPNVCHPHYGALYVQGCYDGAAESKAAVLEMLEAPE